MIGRHYVIRHFGNDLSDFKYEKHIISDDPTPRVIIENVSEGEYIAVWCEPARSSGKSSFNISDFRNIELTDLSSPRHQSDCFASLLKIEDHHLEPLITSTKLILKRPTAEFIFIDNSRERSVDGLISLIHFVDFFANVHDIFRSKAVDAIPGAVIEHYVLNSQEGGYLISEGACFMASETNTIRVWVEIFDNAQNRVATTGVFNLPLRRGSITVVNGPFLTASGKGGTVINPSFSGSFDITII